MASALQKLFRKKVNKHSSATEGRSRTAQDDSYAKAKSVPLSRQGSENERQYLTVSSLNSPSLASVHRGSFSSLSSALPTHNSHIALSRTASNHSAFRNRANSVDMSMLVPGQIVRPGQSSDDMPATIDQFGSIIISDDGLPTPASCTSESKDDDDDDDVQSNGFYRAIMDKIEVLSNHDDVKVILVPSAKHLNGMKDKSLLSSDSYMSLYAFAPSTLFKDRYQSVRQSSNSLQVESFEWAHIRATATLQPEARSVSLVLKKHTEGKRKDTQEERTLHVLSETIVYRSQSAAASSSRKRERRKIRVLLVDGFVATQADAQRPRQAKSTVSDASSKGTITERPNATARLESHTENSLAFPATSPRSTDSTFRSRTVYHIETSRNFLSDYLLLADPPASLSCLRAALKLALETIKKNASDFTKAYVYVPGFDSYNASRIRRGILAKAWHVFVDEARKSDQCNGDVELSRWLGNEGRTRLLAVFENVVLGHCHSKIYMSIRSLQMEADDKLDSIIATYHDHDVSLADLGFVQGVDMSAAFLHASQSLLRGLGEPEEDLDWSLKHKSVSELREMAALSCPPLSSATVTSRIPRFRLRTPLDVLDVMQATLDDISGAAMRTLLSSRRLTGGNEKKSATTSIGTDELIPILAFILIRAMPRKLMSLLYYTRLFGISDATSAKHSWALTTFEAVAQYLYTDPLTLCGRWARDGGAHSTVRSVGRSRASVSMQRAKSAGEQQKDRMRRASLPTGSALATGQPSSTRISIDSTEPVADEESAIFKQPGMPASRAIAAAQARTGVQLSRSGSQHKVLDTASGTLSEESFHKRTLSMSSDLLIRPQIVVRGAPSGRSDSRSSISSRPLLTRNISSAISVATNEAEPNVDRNHRRKSASESWSLFGALSGYGGSSKASLADEVSTAVESALPTSSNTITNDNMTSEGRSPAASSSGWLPTWAHEWSGMSRAPSSTAIERHNSTASTSSRPHSVLSQESNGALGVPIHVGRSNRSVSPLGFPSLDSMPSLDGPHQQSPSAESRQDSSATICSSPREPSSLLSSPSSVLSSPTYKSDQILFKTNRGGSWSSNEPGPVSFAKLVTTSSSSTKRTKSRGRVRSRLLSSPMPSAPLPPQVTSEAARADVSVTGTLSVSEDSVDGRIEEEASRRRPRPVGTLSADQIVRSSVEPTSPARRSVEMYRSRSSDSNDVLPFPSADHPTAKVHDRDVVRREPLQSASSSFLNTVNAFTVNANAWPAGQPLHSIKLQIPSPVDERTDPMTTYHTHV